MVDPLLRGDAHAEGDPADDLAHERLDASERIEVGAPKLRPNGLVAAADVVADPGGRHVPLVGDPAADRLAVARVMVGAEDAELGVARLHASLELREAALVDRAERLDLHRFLLSTAARPAAAALIQTQDGRHPSMRTGPRAAVPNR